LGRADAAGVRRAPAARRGPHEPGDRRPTLPQPENRWYSSVAPPSEARRAYPRRGRRSRTSARDSRLTKLVCCPQPLQSCPRRQREVPTCWGFYASDRTRTRDLRRDRPVLVVPGCAGIGGDYRQEQGLSVVVLRGLRGIGGSFQPPPAGCARDAALSKVQTRGMCAGRRVDPLSMKEGPVSTILLVVHRPVGAAGAAVVGGERG
jgi:hypothetical protein